MALLQFVLTGMKTTAVPSSIHCDHLIEAHEGGDKDVATSVRTEKEIYDFLQACGEKFGIGFWKPGSGVLSAIGPTRRRTGK
jgi:aconitase A